jgi:hypothetical protein
MDLYGGRELRPGLSAAEREAEKILGTLLSAAEFVFVPRMRTSFLRRGPVDFRER